MEVDRSGYGDVIKQRPPQKIVTVLHGKSILQADNISFWTFTVTATGIIITCPDWQVIRGQSTNFLTLCLNVT